MGEQNRENYFFKCRRHTTIALQKSWWGSGDKKQRPCPLPALSLCAVEEGRPLAGAKHSRGASERWGLVQNYEEQARGVYLAGCWPACAVLEIECLAPLFVDFSVM